MESRAALPCAWTGLFVVALLAALAAVGVWTSPACAGASGENTPCSRAGRSAADRRSSGAMSAASRWAKVAVKTSGASARPTQSKCCVRVAVNQHSCGIGAQAWAAASLPGADRD